jgi:DNA-binding MarR family transcriptional regulator
MAQLTDHTGYLLRTAFLRASGLAAETFPAGTHPRDAGVLSMLQAMGPCSQQELSESLHVNRTMMVKLIDGLEARGLVERRRNPDDRRLYAVHLTDAGRAFMKKLGRVAREHDDALLDGLDADERAQLRTLLTRVAEARKLVAGVHPGYRTLGEADTG